MAPKVIAPESAKSAHLSLGMLPFSSISLLLLAIPTMVPAASNISIINNDKIRLIIVKSNALAISSCMNTGSMGGGVEITP